jgi:hypothetical protein
MIEVYNGRQVALVSLSGETFFCIISVSKDLIE